MYRRYIGIGLCMVLAGCGTLKKQWVEYAPDRDAGYLQANTAPALALPSGMAMNKADLSDPYPMPHGALPSKGAKPIDIFPPTLSASKEKQSDDATDDDATDAS